MSLSDISLTSCEFLLYINLELVMIVEFSFTFAAAKSIANKYCVKYCSAFCIQNCISRSILYTNINYNILELISVYFMLYNRSVFLCLCGHLSQFTVVDN